MDTLAGMKRTHSCGALTAADAGTEVILCGWVSRQRDHGGLIFIDLRDRSGTVQLVFSPEINQAALLKADGVRTEYVLSVRGAVRLRSPETVNPAMETGAIEVCGEEVRILNPAKTPPFYIQDNVDVDETVRLKYRYLDLRRPEMQHNLILRHRVAKTMRDFFDSRDFIEVETPMLTKSTPEGARDYLVPSRVNPGKFYALPQSPQIFKQILMVAGYERYFQIVRCFRDEDLRADRQSHHILVLDEDVREHRPFPHLVRLVAAVTGLVVRVIGAGAPRPVAAGNIVAQAELDDPVGKAVPLACLAGEGVAQRTFLKQQPRFDLHALDAGRIEIDRRGPVDRAGARLGIGRIPEAVLAAQILLDLLVDLLEGTVAGQFEVSAAGLSEEFLQISLYIGTVLNNEVNYIQIAVSSSCIISIT